MTSLLCETVTGDTMAQLLAARNAAADVGVDIVELRLDGVKDLDVAGALHGCRARVIATCRPKWEGGRFDGSEEARRRVLEQALAAGADYVDVEWKALRPFESLRVAPSAVEGRQAQATLFAEFVHANRSRVVLSSHDFTGVPTDLCTRAGAMRDTGAAVIKVAVTAARLSDTLPLRELAKQGDAVVIGMGDAGVPSRLLATRFGSRWTYGGNGVAPGQIPAARMIGEFRFRAITEQTSVYGLAGAAVLTSVIPARRNAAFAAAGVDAVCIPLPAADPADIQTFADALGIIGWERCM
jgi:3-dehydroquinate dehydratase / shikimate dehydrogenase